MAQRCTQSIVANVHLRALCALDSGRYSLTISSRQPPRWVSGDNLSEFRHLNVIDKAKGKLAPGEAGAAAELQHYLGGSLERIKTADSRADFIFSSGPHQGKTVDFMFAPNDFNSAAKANQFFEKNLARNEAQLRAHVEKADLVPLDFRFLSEQNQALFMKVVERLPIERQAQIIILR